jgi:hypothetical protein
MTSQNFCGFPNQPRRRGKSRSQCPLTSADHPRHVRFVPKADIMQRSKIPGLAMIRLTSRRAKARIMATAVASEKFARA